MTIASKRRALLIAAAAFGGVPIRALAQQPPARPIRWIVPYPAGGGSDFFARTVGAQMAQQMGQPVVIDNKPGAATIVGAQELAKAPNDGSTVMSADNGTLVFNAALYRKLPYDPQRDLLPVGLMARFPLILVANPAAGFRSAGDFVRTAMAQPGKLSYASPGAGSPHNLAMELVKQRTGTFVVHIPYRGAAPAVQDVLGNQVPLMVIDTAVGLPHIRSGKLVPLGVLAKQRLEALPQAPTLQEQGIGDTEVFAWQAMVVPAATPRETVNALWTQLQRALTTADVAKKLQEFGLQVTPAGPDEAAAYIRTEIDRWHALIRQRGLVLE